LPEIADVVKGKVPILLEGGIRRGCDIFKAIARGATSVIVNQPVIWGYKTKVIFCSLILLYKYYGATSSTSINLAVQCVNHNL